MAKVVFDVHKTSNVGGRVRNMKKYGLITMCWMQFAAASKDWKRYPAGRARTQPCQTDVVDPYDRETSRTPRWQGRVSVPELQTTPRDGLRMDLNTPKTRCKAVLMARSPREIVHPVNDGRLRGQGELEDGGGRGQRGEWRRATRSWI